MNKIANVVYPYSPKNDDELELKVGDRIEVIGIEEEGWWKGTLKGRIGVFPSNFVQVIGTESPSPASQNINKLNSIFGSRVGSKNSLSSSNSMSNSNNNLNIHNNNNNSSSNNNINSSNTSNSSTNLMMNNTRQQHDIEPASQEYPFSSQAGEESLHSTNSLSERRPRPLRGIGFGDIFAQAKTKPLPADPITRSSTVSERLGAATSGTNPATDSSSSNTLGRLPSSTLQKPIPKKPPPPTPVETSGSNGTTNADQAPALPPKPSNQFSPFIPQRPLPNPTASQRTIREQARVIFAYRPSNDDELEMEVDDIIDIIDKNIEDVGWWKGELRGKVGVFPDNFVQLIGTQEAMTKDSSTQHSSRVSSGANNSSPRNSSGGNAGGMVQSHQHQQQMSAGNLESSVGGKIKSVFAGTPKGFSKELESNLEKHSNPASFLSLKRNKLQQQMSSSLVGDQQPASMTTNSGSEMGGGGLPPVPATTSLILSEHRDQAQRSNGHSAGNHEPTSPGKLNHITANRAKGPTRRPPSNILNKRNQLSELGSSHIKSEIINGTEEDVPPASNLSAQKQAVATINQPHSNQNSLTSSPNEQLHHHNHLPMAGSNYAPQLGSLASLSTHDSVASPQQQPSLSSFKTNSPPSNGLSGENSQPVTPKTSQRNNQPPIIQPSDSKGKLTSTSGLPTPPPWMVELRKTNAEKKRDPLPTASSNLMEEIGAVATIVNSPTTPTVPTASTSSLAPPVTATPATASLPAPTQAEVSSTPSIQPVATSVAPSLKSSTTVSAKQALTNDISPARSDESSRSYSKSVSHEISELKNDVRKLQEDFKTILGLKDVIETMKVELRTCQSATESQRKYIKELVNNLADERKRIAAMQTEIDRNLK